MDNVGNQPNLELTFAHPTKQWTELSLPRVLSFTEYNSDVPHLPFILHFPGAEHTYHETAEFCCIWVQCFLFTMYFGENGKLDRC